MFKKILPEMWSIWGHAKRFYTGQTEMVLFFLQEKFCSVWGLTQKGASENLV